MRGIIRKETNKAAARFLLPLEFVLGMTAVAWGLTGFLSRGWLHRALQTEEELYIWAATFLALGGLQGTLAVVEWLFGKRWCNRAMMRVSQARWLLAFFSIAAWGYAMLLWFTVPGFDRIFVLILLSPLYLLMQAWCLKENMKVKYALDERYYTPGLELYR